MIGYLDFLKIYNAKNGPPLLRSELQALLNDPYYKKLLENESVFVERIALTHEALEYIGDFAAFFRETMDKPFYIPAKEELLRYTDEMYYEKTSHQEELAKMLAKDFFGGSTLMIKDEIDEMVGELEVVNVNVQSVMRRFLERFEIEDIDHLNKYAQAFSMVANSTRIWENRGHTPEELFKIETDYLKPLQSTPFKVIDGGKTG